MRKHLIVLCLLTLVGSGSIYGQTTTTTAEPTQPQPTQPAEPTQPPPIYVFPDKRERFKRYISSTVGTFRLVRTAASAGIQQWRNTPEEWGQGTKGFSKRYASALGRNAIQQTVTYGLDTTLQLDTGFQTSARDGFFPRLKDALIQNVTSRTRGGKRVISAPRLAGVYAGGIIPAETWYPSRYSYKDGIRSGTTTLLAGFGINVIREFVVQW